MSNMQRSGVGFFCSSGFFFSKMRTPESGVMCFSCYYTHTPPLALSLTKSAIQTRCWVCTAAAVPVEFALSVPYMSHWDSASKAATAASEPPAATQTGEALSTQWHGKGGREGVFLKAEWGWTKPGTGAGSAVSQPSLLYPSPLP